MTPIPTTYFTTQLETMLQDLKDLVEIESPSFDKAALDRIGAAIVERLRPLAPVIHVDTQASAGDHIAAQWPAPNGDTRGGFLIMCHFDTVHPVGALATNPVRIEEGELYGPGVYDMKASIVQVITALKALKEQHRWPDRPVTALFTSDEEIGSRSSRALIEERARDCRLVLCMEPGLPGGAVKTARKGVGNFEIVVRGRATHAGADHASGVNAIEEMAHQILALQALTDYERGTTVNVGVVNGGTRNNVVPEECRLDVDLRVVNAAEGKRMETAIHNLRPNHPAARVEISGSVYRPPMPRSEIIGAAYERVRTIAAELGQDLSEGGTGGASDANFVAPLGAPVLDGLGPLGSGAHTGSESLTIASLPPRTALVAAILSEWPAA